MKHMVSYKLKPDRVAENERPPRGLRGAARGRPPGLRYATFRLGDGVSFVHIVSHEEADGSNALTSLPAFKAFSAGVRDRCVEPPVRVDLTEIGSYGFFERLRATATRTAPDRPHRVLEEGAAPVPRPRRRRAARPAPLLRAHDRLGRRRRGRGAGDAGARLLRALADARSCRRCGRGCSASRTTGRSTTCALRAAARRRAARRGRRRRRRAGARARRRARARTGRARRDLARSSQLAPAQRGCVILKDVLDHSLEEIAALLELSVPAVKAALHRGRAALRRRRRERRRRAARASLGRARALRRASSTRTTGTACARCSPTTCASTWSRGARPRAGARSASTSPTTQRTTAGTSAPAWLDGREVLAVLADAGERRARATSSSSPWRDERVASIRDFRYVPYIARDAELAPRALSAALLSPRRPPDPAARLRAGPNPSCAPAPPSSPPLRIQQLSRRQPLRELLRRLQRDAPQRRGCGIR